MAEYIKRDSVIGLLNTLKERVGRQGDSDAEGAFMIARNAIGDLPTIDRSDGQWTEYIDEQHGGLMGRCSACGESTLYAVSYDLFGNRHEMRFCPKCGAKMDGKEQENGKDI